MTGIVCDSLRRAALGDVWSGHSAGSKVDDVDAALIERTWRTLSPQHRDLLRWIYIRNSSPAFVCRRMGIKQRPTSVFDFELRRAELEIERLASAGGAPAGVRNIDG